MKKSIGAMYGIIRQQAALLSFVEAFWVMGVIFLCMLPLVLLLRNARDLHGPVKQPQVLKPVAIEQETVSEPEMAGAFH